MKIRRECTDRDEVEHAREVGRHVEAFRRRLRDLLGRDNAVAREVAVVLRRSRRSASARGCRRRRRGERVHDVPRGC